MAARRRFSSRRVLGLRGATNGSVEHNPSLWTLCLKGFQVSPRDPILVMGRGVSGCLSAPPRATPPGRRAGRKRTWLPLIANGPHGAKYPSATGRCRNTFQAGRRRADGTRRTDGRHGLEASCIHAMCLSDRTVGARRRPAALPLAAQAKHDVLRAPESRRRFRA